MIERKHMRLENFTKEFTCFYSDNSCQSHHRGKSVLKNKEHRLLDQSAKASISLERIRYISQDRKLYNDRLSDLCRAIEYQINSFALMNTSAIKIQRAFRQFQTIRDQDDYCIQSIREDLMKDLYLLRKQNTQLLYHTGITTEVAGNRITKWVRRVLFLRKIQRISEAYVQFCNERRCKLYEQINSCFHYYLSRQIVKDALFCKYRERRLVEIRMNLNILTIKKHWEELGLSCKIMKQRYKKHHARKTKKKYDRSEMKKRNKDIKDAFDKKAVDKKSYVNTKERCSSVFETNKQEVKIISSASAHISNTLETSRSAISNNNREKEKAFNKYSDIFQEKYNKNLLKPNKSSERTASINKDNRSLASRRMTDSKLPVQTKNNTRDRGHKAVANNVVWNPCVVVSESYAPPIEKISYSHKKSSSKGDDLYNRNKYRDSPLPSIHKNHSSEVSLDCANRPAERLAYGFSVDRKNKASHRSGFYKNR